MCCDFVPGSTWHFMITQHKHLTLGPLQIPWCPQGRKGSLRVAGWPAGGAFLSCGPVSQAKVTLESCSVLFSSGPHRIIRTSSSLTPGPTNSQLRMAQNPSLDNQAFLTGLEPGPDLPMGYCEQMGCREGEGHRPEGRRNHLSGPLLTTCPLPSPEVPVCGSPRQSLRPHEPSPPRGRYHQLLLTEQG